MAWVYVHCSICESYVVCGVAYMLGRLEEGVCLPWVHMI